MFMDSFNEVQKALKTLKAKDLEKHFAAQINLTDANASGAMYLEVQDHNVIFAPYDYVDRDLLVTVSAEDFIQVMTSKLDFDKAVADGTLQLEGSDESRAVLKSLVKKPVKRTCKRAAAEPSEKKTNAKKATADKKPVSKKTATKKSAAK